jgi:hypothetical protein
MQAAGVAILLGSCGGGSHLKVLTSTVVVRKAIALVPMAVVVHTSSC